MRAVAFAVLAASAVGCIVFTGSTDGYEELPKASDARPGDAGGGGSLDLRCLSAQDCAGGVDAAPASVCCVALSGTTSATATCQAKPCGGAFPVQLCASDTECTGTTCILQQCTLSGAAVTLRACGAVPTCTAK